MEINRSQIMYNEVFDFLNILGNTYIDKIPKNLYNFIKEQRVEEYNTTIDIKQNIPEQISDDALAFIAYLNLNYWCSVEEKESLMKIYSENDKKEEELRREKYNPDNLFKKDNNENAVKTDNQIIIYKESLIKRIINKIKKLFGN